MFGFKFIKFQPNQYVLKYKKGKLKKEGPGLAFYYYVPTTSLVAIPVGSEEAPFIFQEVTADFQNITIQGQVTYRIKNPKEITGLLNYSIDPKTKYYISEDPAKLPQRLINSIQVLTKRNIKDLPLIDALLVGDKLADQVSKDIKSSPEINALGLEILSFSVLGIKPSQETSRALEAKVREQILKEADDAIYYRRNSSVEQERIIKENELNTQIAVENKNKQIRETQMDAEKAVQTKQHELTQAKMQFDIQMEKEKQALIETAVANARAQADSKAYEISATMQALEKVSPHIIQALSSMGMQPDKLIALAFQGLADKAEKIGQLNISPELLQTLLRPGQ